MRAGQVDLSRRGFLKTSIAAAVGAIGVSALPNLAVSDPIIVESHIPTFLEFQRSIVRGLASNFGMSYAELADHFGGASYSSARVQMLELSLQRGSL